MTSGLLAIIPARGGSKRLPRKNILPLAGKPLIAWTIEAALQSKEVDRVIVSTDDPEIAVVAKSFGAEVPFMRSPALATDTATTLDVVLDVLYRMPGINRMIILQPTSPLRTAQDIDNAVSLLDTRRAKAVISVCESETPVAWMNSLPEDGCMDNFLLDHIKNKRSQDLPTTYLLNGSIYVINSQTVESEKSLIPRSGAYAYKMDRKDSVDIDDELDFIIAETLLKNRQSK